MKYFKKIFYIVFLFAFVSEVYSQTITWNRVYSGPQQESGRNGIQTFDGGYMILNFVEDANGGTYLLNLDPYSFDARLNAGQGSNLASGIYFYKLETQGTNGQKLVSIKRMVLVK